MSKKLGEQDEMESLLPVFFSTDHKIEVEQKVL
jgi:hypothetical protein